MSVLKSSWQIAAAAGEPHSMIRVQNLQAIVKVGRDAWGRTGKTQPILISATLSLREAFEQASIDDSVDNPSTVHYGTLSKAILEAVSGHHAVDTDQTLRSLLNHILRHVTGKGLDSAETATHEDRSQPILDSKALKSLELKLFLPKASLIGSGVSLAGIIVYANSGDAEAYSMSLKLHELRIPAIIGVNPNERPSKQIIVTNIELDTWSAESDLYNELEEVVVKTVEESSFQTLEALATHVSHRIIKYFIVPRVHPSGDDPHERIRIRFEKPTAVTFADAPAVEILVDTDPDINVLTLWLSKRMAEKKMPPFPLQGRLDQWIQEHDTESKGREHTGPS